MTPSVVVTGAAGFIGSHVCRALVEAGHAVVGVDNFDPYYARALKERALAPLRAGRAFRLVEGDVRDTGLMRRVLRGASALVHLAARAGVRASVEDGAVYWDVNVAGTASVLEACRSAGVRRVVAASSSSVYGASAIPFREDTALPAPLSPYAATKTAMEDLVRGWAARGSGRGVVLRLFSVYGPGQRPDQAVHRFVRAALARGPVERYGGGDSARDYTHVHDVTRGILAALRHTRGPGVPCLVVNLGSGRATILNALLQMIGEVLGPLRVSPVESHPADVPVTLADIALARQVLGYAPRVPLEQGILDVIEWCEAGYEGQSRAAS
ncbi:MAG: hypothetical protein A2W29_03200 [Gemmatimonadetes bacterium RBG_16_66_8]|nr:MAG: hypothetical protein A2W29_03200 [Gemmatimonadetes bacterium RBG_16_66_8]